MNSEIDYKNFIKKIIHRYYPVDDKTLALLYPLAKIRKTQKGEILLPIGKTARHVHILHIGAVIAYFIDEEGNTYNKNIFVEENFVGSTVSYLTKTPSKFMLEVIEDGVIISFYYEYFRKLIEEETAFKNFYIAYLEKNWVLDKEKREVDIVMKDASTRYLELLDQHPELDKRIPLNHIASHLGITPTQLSRIRKKIKK